MNSTPGAPLPTIAAGGFEDPVFGPSPAMRRILEEVTRAAAGVAHIVISGEPGTGREMIAREIHRQSRPSHASFVKVACSIQPSEDLERELFGDSTSAKAGQSWEPRTLERISPGGRLHEALGGTIFFHHLTRLPARIQARLVRLFRDGEAVMVHEKNPVDFKVRAIASVEHNYDRAVEEGRVLEDLHQLLSVVRIDLPALRDRREDIPALATFFVRDCCRRAQFPEKALSESAHQLLSALPWHGNAVELRRLLQGLVHRVGGKIIHLSDVLNAVEIDGRERPFMMGGTLREARTRFEREYIAAVLLQHHGRIPEAAQTLGIQRTNLYRKLKLLRLAKKPNGRLSE